MPVETSSIAVCARSRLFAAFAAAFWKIILSVTRMVTAPWSLQAHQRIEHAVGGRDHLAHRLEGPLRAGQMDHLLVERDARRRLAQVTEVVEQRAVLIGHRLRAL